MPTPRLIPPATAKTASRRPPAPAPAPAPAAKDETANAPLCVFAFSAGALDTTMQIGTIHALMLTNVKPDVVLGVSAGAINAVSLGEVMNAWDERSMPEEHRDAARAGRFLHLLEAYRETPMELIRALWPDYSEVHAYQPLGALETPVQFKKERESRKRSVDSRQGIVELMNALLHTRLRVSSITRLLRIALEGIAAGDIRDPRKRARVKRRSLFAGWLYMMLRPPVLLAAGFTVGQFVWASRRGARQEKQSGKPSDKRDHRTAKALLFNWNGLRAWFRRGCVSVMGAIIVAGGPPFLLWVAPIYSAVRPLLFPVLWLFRKIWAGLKWTWRKVRGASQSADEPRISGVDAFLARFGLRKEIGDSFALKQTFVRTFDPGYYGKFNMDYAVNTALYNDLADRDKPQTPDKEPLRKKLGDYRGIRIVPVAANIRTLEMEGLPADVPVVDALMAATAMVPLMSAEKLEREGRPEWYIDGANVANEPIREALCYLRKNLLPECEGREKINVFSVTPFPLPRGKDDGLARANEGEHDYTELTKVARRGMELQRFRDAELEQDLMQLYNATLPQDKAVFRAGTVPIIRAEPHRIEADRPLRLNVLVPTAPPEQRRKLVDEAIAVGCFQTLKKLLDTSMITPPELWSGSCKDLVAQFRQCSAPDFPGSDAKLGPGISKVCEACRKRNGNGSDVFLRAAAAAPPEGNGKEKRGAAPAGPAGAAATARAAGKRLQTGNPIETLVRLDAAVKKEAQGAPEAPKGQPKVSKDVEPSVACLFSGGVFRGVFQIGVANALQLLGVQPRVVAGASVGSITGALIAEVLRPDATPADRVQSMRKLGATYLALDRLVITDRLADFVRKLTLRAGSAKFSLRDVDVVFRRLEQDTTDRYVHRLRRIAAGFERIAYITPYELAALARSIRDGRFDELGRQLGGYAQKMLDRYGVGLEALGAEPMVLLLRELVLRAHKLHPENPGDTRTCADEPERASFGIFGKKLDLIAVTTNLRTGCMEVLKAPSVPKGNEGDPRLIEGLLASSAFPGVFRPQWSWEVFRKPGKNAVQFCDGGVLDNLPFNAVIDHLRAIEHEEKAPDCPHLIFTASLEPVAEAWDSEESAAVLKETSGSWTKLWKRAGIMKHNKKIDDFARAEREVQEIYDAKGRRGFRPLDVHVIAVKPKWLCKTFGFHPMLGFRRENQAASIAHGCFETFAEFSTYLRTGAGNHTRIAPWAPASPGRRHDAKASAKELLAEAKLAIADAGRLFSRALGLAPADRLRKMRRLRKSEIYAAARTPGFSTPDAQELHEAAFKLRDEAVLLLRRRYLEKWIGAKVPLVEGFKPHWENGGTATWESTARKVGLCWHLPGKDVRCPFARQKGAVPEDERNFPENLARIHELCLAKKTHEEAPAK